LDSDIQKEIWALQQRLTALESENNSLREVVAHLQERERKITTFCQEMSECYESLPTHFYTGPSAIHQLPSPYKLTSLSEYDDYDETILV
jgi:predicted  nucleic acid-binding Zn-ribbon protein